MDSINGTSYYTYKSFIHHEMVAQKKQRQTEYNETYTQITIKHYKRDKKN